MVPGIVTEAPTAPLKVPGRVDAVAAMQNSPIGAGDLISFDDGTEALLRPILSADWGALSRFHAHLSDGRFSCATSIRIESSGPTRSYISPASTALTGRRSSSSTRVRSSLSGAMTGWTIAAVAEVAFVVADEFQHHGLGTMLLQRLVENARHARITSSKPRSWPKTAPCSRCSTGGFPMTPRPNGAP